jgi:hypothetical protein
LLSGRPSGPVKMRGCRTWFDPWLAGSLSIGRRELAPKHPVGVAKAGENQRQQNNEACTDEFQRGPICGRRPDGGLRRY